VRLRERKAPLPVDDIRKLLEKDINVSELLSASEKA
jgi:hypothetical protein